MGAVRLYLPGDRADIQPNIMGQTAAAKALGITKKKLTYFLKKHPECYHLKGMYPGHKWIDVPQCKNALWDKKRAYLTKLLELAKARAAAENARVTELEAKLLKIT